MIFAPWTCALLVAVLGTFPQVSDPPAGTGVPLPATMGHSAGRQPQVEWVQPGNDTNQLTWGIRGHLVWGLPRPSGKAVGGPRGLVRLYYPVLSGGDYDLVNFIAVEPVVRGRRGLSELEPSQLDRIAGKRLWVVTPEGTPPDATQLAAGKLTRLADGVESLAVQVRVERFQNGAHVTLTVSQRSDAADEIRLAIHTEPDSAPIDYCILTATMGNKARTRLLWLKDEVVHSLRIYPDYQDPDFAPHRFFHLDRLYQTPSGEVVTAITTDEANPAAVPAPPGLPHWRYRGFPVTQYWKKPAGTWRPDLHVAVNGRYMYWLSRHPIPGGIAFENFEMRERFYDGQQFVFGITGKSPAELGFSAARE